MVPYFGHEINGDLSFVPEIGTQKTGTKSTLLTISCPNCGKKASSTTIHIAAKHTNCDSLESYAFLSTFSSFWRPIISSLLLTLRIIPKYLTFGASSALFFRFPLQKYVSTSLAEPELGGDRPCETISARSEVGKRVDLLLVLLKSGGYLVGGLAILDPPEESRVSLVVLRGERLLAERICRCVGLLPDLLENVRSHDLDRQIAGRLAGELVPDRSRIKLAPVRVGRIDQRL